MPSVLSIALELRLRFVLKTTGVVFLIRNFVVSNASTLDNKRGKALGTRLSYTVESSPRLAINTSILFPFLLRFALNDQEYSLTSVSRVRL